MAELKGEAGQCPKCGADLDYGDSDLQDMQMGYECWCRECDWFGTEWHSLVFECFTDEE